MNNLENAKTATSGVAAVQDNIKNQATKLSIQIVQPGPASETSLYAAAKAQFQRDLRQRSGKTIA
jgi:hypothetical protein